MTEQEKQLLLMDLCARLPHDVEIQMYNRLEGESKPFVVNKPLTFDHVAAFIKNDVVVNIKPYLRPMSSMTEKEEFEYHQYAQKDLQEISEEHFEILKQTSIYSANMMDWLNANHFDYRGLIEKGLALEATEGMYE